jgi:hypothetical protein
MDNSLTNRAMTANSTALSSTPPSQTRSAVHERATVLNPQLAPAPVSARKSGDGSLANGAQHLLHRPSQHVQHLRIARKRNLRSVLRYLRERRTKAKHPSDRKRNSDRAVSIRMDRFGASLIFPRCRRMSWCRIMMLMRWARRWRRFSSSLRMRSVPVFTDISHDRYTRFLIVPYKLHSVAFAFLDLLFGWLNEFGHGTRNTRLETCQIESRAQIPPLICRYGKVEYSIESFTSYKIVDMYWLCNTE